VKREIKREGRCQEIKQYGKLQLEGCGSFCQQGKSFFSNGRKSFSRQEKKITEEMTNEMNREKREKRVMHNGCIYHLLTHIAV
jgi:hypothetical protein